MNYYPFHIGDFRSATLHLNNAEELAYRRALDWYYDTEKPIPLDIQWVSRRLRVATQDLETVLKDFFSCTADGWIHERCDREIATYTALADKNRRNGQKGGRPKASIQPKNNPVGSESVASGPPVASQTNPNQEPRTNNQEEIPPNPPTGDSPDSPDGSIEIFAARVPTQQGAVCLALKSVGVADVNPSHSKLLALLGAGVTLESIVAAARDCVDRGKPSFRYVLGCVERQEQEARDLALSLARPRVSRRDAARESFAQKDRDEGMRRWEEMTGRAHPDRGPQASNVIDITPRSEPSRMIGVLA